MSRRPAYFFLRRATELLPCRRLWRARNPMRRFLLIELLRVLIFIFVSPLWMAAGWPLSLDVYRILRGAVLSTAGPARVRPRRLRHTDGRGRFTCGAPCGTRS